MIPRTYSLPDKLINESNNDWIARAVAAIPDDAMAAIADEYARRTRRGSLGWPHVRYTARSVISEITGHGAGVSAGIVARLGIESEDGRIHTYCQEDDGTIRKCLP